MIENFQKYQQPTLPGVKLPQIIIEQKYYDALGIPNTSSNYQFLRKLCHKGVLEKGIDKKDNAQIYYERVKTELSLFEELGFIDYVLLNWDILKFCHENGIPTGPGRGSAAGSLVLYLIGVTKVDPIQYELYFERFVSKSRAKKIVVDGETYLDGSLLADVDNDIAYERRQEVIKFIEEKYSGKTCKILTLNTLSSKLCVKECGKLVGELPESAVNEISDLIPKKFGKVASLKNACEESDKFKEWASDNKKIFEIAQKLEGLIKNTGVHPSGIAISHYNLEEIMPLQTTGDGDLVSGYDMNDVASLCVKFDILGLRTLSVIHDVCKQINFDITTLDLQSKDIYDHLQNLQTPQGLFQIEADTNFKVAQKVRPKSLEELSAVVAIARPGALDFLDRYAQYVNTGDFQSVHPFFDDILQYTGGIPLYQEQLMRMAVKVGFTLDESEQLRRIVGKKKVDQMSAWQDKIKEKIQQNNLDPVIGEVLWKVAEDSANYSFNKSHSISYAILAAWTLYLKFKHPQNFFLSLLKMTQFEPDSYAEINKITQELAYFDIKLLAPDLTKSKADFSIEKKDIRYGLNSIKGISDNTMSALMEFCHAELKNKYDVFTVAKQVGLNIGALSALIQAGALNSFSEDRCRMVLEAQSFNILTDREKRLFSSLGEKYNYDILKSIHDCVKNKQVGDDNKPIMSEKRFQTFKQKYAGYREIYDKNSKYPKFANWYFETKLLGYSYSQIIKDIFSEQSAERYVNCMTFNALDINENVRMVGVIKDCYRKKSTNGNKYAKLEIADETGKIKAMLLDSRQKLRLTEYLENGNKLPKEENIVIVTGKKGEDILFIDKLAILDEKIYMKLSEIK
jgi:DNA polymerase III subunit alpha